MRVSTGDTAYFFADLKIIVFSCKDLERAQHISSSSHRFCCEQTSCLHHFPAICDQSFIIYDKRDLFSFHDNKFSFNSYCLKNFWFLKLCFKSKLFWLYIVKKFLAWCTCQPVFRTMWSTCWWEQAKLRTTAVVRLTSSSARENTSLVSSSSPTSSCLFYP